MALNIKNERVCSLARDVARRTGQTQTGAIESALEAYLRLLVEQDREHQARRDRETAEQQRLIRALVASIPPAPQDAPTTVEVLEELYDETGLPR
ncbi:MAG TPA: type II toxin-antitoxin system VapB family antitoxin [Intrasporangiaceae bacterium]|nr:type II toxin-antitoxin system VapB family antitoxin [Intrasporangiaceae bacterium]